MSGLLFTADDDGDSSRCAVGHVTVTVRYLADFDRRELSGMPHVVAEG